MFGFGDDEDEDELEQQQPEEGSDQSAPPLPPPMPGALPPSAASAPIDGMNPDQKAMVNDYIKKKYQLGPEYSAEARQKLTDENSADDKSLNWTAALGALASGLQGGNSAETGAKLLQQQKAARDSKLINFDKKRDQAIQDMGMQKAGDLAEREADPNSPESKIAQEVALSMGLSPEQASKLTADQFKRFSPALEQKYKIAQNAADKKEDRSFKEKMLGMNLQEKREAAQMKAQERADKVADQKSEGMKALDKDYAKDYNEWTSAGKPTLDKNLEALEKAKAALMKDKSLTGGLTGTLPDALTSDRVLKQRQMVQGAVQNSLKATLGAQFTEKEGERILKNAYNEAASPETNIASLNALIGQLKSQRDANDAKAQHFEKNGSLQGFGQTRSMMAEAKKNAPKEPTMTADGMVRVQAPDGSVRKIPKEQLRQAMAAGGVLVDQDSAVAGN